MLRLTVCEKKIKTLTGTRSKKKKQSIHEELLQLHFNIDDK